MPVKVWDVCDIVDLFERHKEVPGHFVVADDYDRVVAENERLVTALRKIQAGLQTIQLMHGPFGDIVRYAAGL